jgi:hypothetical protein
LVLPERTVYMPIYLQNIGGESTNILVEGCDFIVELKPYEKYANGEELTKEETEYLLFGDDTGAVRRDDSPYEYYSRVDGARYLEQHDNSIYDNPTDALEWAGWIYEVISATGSDLAKPDAEEILTDAQTHFDTYWEAQANA